MEAKGIRCQVHYIPIHLQPFYRNNFGFKTGDFSIAEEFYKQEISIPIYPTLDEIDLKYITTSIIESLES
jgi:dTDP-4-amino-4,6-dideoxygalactose transaminase